MSLTNVLGTKKVKIVLPKDLWGTPAYLYDGLNEEFGFRLDAAANSANSKCLNFIAEESDAFKVEWQDPVGALFNKAGSVFLNPPYSQSAGGLINWVERAYQQSQKHNMAVACVVPGDTSTKYRKFAMRYGSEIRDLDHRVRFMGAVGSPPWPTAIFIFRPVKHRIIGGANVSVWDYRVKK